MSGAGSGHKWDWASCDASSCQGMEERERNRGGGIEGEKAKIKGREERQSEGRRGHKK